LAEACQTAGARSPGREAEQPLAAESAMPTAVTRAVRYSEQISARLVAESRKFDTKGCEEDLTQKEL